MKVKIVAIGKTNEKWLADACYIYESRLKHYINFEFVIIPDIKNAGKLSENIIKEKEAILVASAISQNDFVVLLDEKGTQFSSVEFSDFISKKMLSSVQCLTFVIGGAYGFANDIKKRASLCVSLSKMTFTHQMIRLIFIEQLYRAFTILKGESYHHE